ncbi:hypothetical protein PC123_g10357 [Phytophthora cactorum]|nr:hypothetical protein PC120_g17453 [Phytophthora cactorum]KAG4054540.1 hypothetical protein PC123_g10357 [Phytophthora cactorum]
MVAASATTSPLGEAHAEPEYVIPAPPPVEYPTAEAAEAAIHEWTLANRYNVIRNKQTRNDNGDVRYVLFACDHAGGPQNNRKLTDSGRQRKMSRSKRDGCKMRISIVAVDSSNTAGPWKIAHTKDGSQVHNHPASSDVRVHVTHRQRSARRLKSSSSTSTDLIALQEAAGVSTSRIYATMVWRTKTL